MSNLTIGVVVESLHKALFNRQLARVLAGLLPPGTTVQFIEVGELSLHDQDLDASLPEPVQRFKVAVTGVDVLLFVMPEHDRGMPGMPKNAVD